MIKLENVVLASPEQMEFIVEGMRNPMNSWEKSDSGNGCDSDLCSGPCAFSPQWCGNTPRYVLGENDYTLMQKLSKAGTDHRKYMRMLPVYVRITAPLYWWKEFDTYKVGTVANSCSTMHKIQAKEFTLEDFSCEHLMNVPGEGVLPPLAVLETTREIQGRTIFADESEVVSLRQQVSHLDTFIRSVISRLGYVTDHALLDSDYKGL